MAKKLFLILAAVMMIALPAAAYDFGGSVDASGSFVIDDDTTTISPSAKVTGWVKVPFEGGSLSTEAYYKFSDSIVDGNSTTSNDVDVTLLKCAFTLPIGTLNVGRYSFSDVTSSVFAMTSDGANLSANVGKLKVGGYVGYTGLLNGKTSGVGMAADADPDSLYPLSSKNLVFLANVSAPNFFGGNTFAVEGLGKIDMNDNDYSYNCFYGTLSAAGPITTTVYYSASATGSYVDLEEFGPGLLLKGSVVSYLPFKSMSLTVKGAYSTEFFEGISSSSCIYGTANAGVSATIKPVNSLLCMLSADLEAFTVDGFEAQDTIVTAMAKWQAMSDLSTFLSVKDYIPMLDGDTNELTISVGATLSF